MVLPDPWGLTPEMLLDAIWKPYFDSVTPIPIDDMARAVSTNHQNFMPEQPLSEAQRVDILVQSMSHGAGTTVALHAAMLGIVSALRNVPGVRDEVLSSLERTKASQLAECMNPVLVEQFDQTDALIRLALDGELTATPSLTN